MRTLTPEEYKAPTRMDKLLIQGGRPLRGEVSISGARNAALPILCASAARPPIPLELPNVPPLNDIGTILTPAAANGRACRTRGARHRVTPLGRPGRPAWKPPTNWSRPCARPSWCWAPLVARFGRARVSLPGGCAIGQRPVDQHIKGLAAMGAHIHIEHGYVVAEADRLQGASILTDMVTVTGTENLMMAAALAEGRTALENAAREPEIVDLARTSLIAMGAHIEGHGTDRIVIDGVRPPAWCHPPHCALPHRGRDLFVRRGGHRRRYHAAPRCARDHGRRARQAARRRAGHRHWPGLDPRPDGRPGRARRVFAPANIRAFLPTCRRS